MTSNSVALFALMVVLPPASVSSTTGHRTLARRSATARGMARIPDGSYRPLYAVGGTARVHVGTFSLDTLPVTRRDFLHFVRLHPHWQRGRIDSRYAEAAYLADWPTAAHAGNSEDMRRPVTSVSWFAATAYCAAEGKRLPTLDEWEYVAVSTETRRDASRDPEYRRHLLSLYALRAPGKPRTVGSTPPNVYGIRDLHGIVWEWTQDFIPVTAGEDSGAMHHVEDSQRHHLFCAGAAMGAADPADYPAFLRFAMRAGLGARSTVSGVGFRCAAG